MNDTEISCFLSVARTGSFTISARELSSTQQAVSRNIQSLENELGFPLLNRTTHAVTLTWAGERFRQWRIEHDAQLSALERQSRRMAGEGANELYVAWTDWTGCPESVEENLRDFSRNYPSVRLYPRQGTMEEVIQMLKDGNADIAVLPEYSTHRLRGVIILPPFATQQLYVISKDIDHLPDPISVLSEKHLIASSLGEESTAEARRRVNMFCAEIGIAPKILDIVPNSRSSFSQLLCGSCYTIAPATMAYPGLHMLPLPSPSLRLTFAIPQGRLSPWVSLFESFVRQKRRVIE